MKYAIALCYNIFYKVSLFHKFIDGVMYMELSEVLKRVRVELAYLKEILSREHHVELTSVKCWENG